RGLRRIRRQAQCAPAGARAGARVRQSRRSPPRTAGRARPEARTVMIDINNESGLDVDVEALLRLVQHHLLALHVSPDAELAIVLVDEAAMEQLHVQWMDEPGPTDVLSFP